MVTAATSRQQSTRRRSTLLSRVSRPWLKSNSQSLHQTQGDSNYGHIQEGERQSRHMIAPSHNGLTVEPFTTLIPGSDSDNAIIRREDTKVTFESKKTFYPKSE